MGTKFRSKQPTVKVRNDDVTMNQFDKAKQDLLQNGVCILRGVIPPEQITAFRTSLEQVFARGISDQVARGARSDLTLAAERIKSEGRGGDLLEEETEIETGGRYLTEIEAGRWHRGVQDFELNSVLPTAVATVLGETDKLHFYMDHLFLKEAGSKLQTAWHQDAPYFPFECDANKLHPAKAAVCWVPVDVVASNSGGMRYVKGSHKWREYAPNVLITNQAIDKNSETPVLPNIDMGIQNGKYEIITFQNVKPGDVIIHHPNCVHGSSANTSASHRRLAASVRYVGSQVRWLKKKTNPEGASLAKQWEINRQAGYLTLSYFLARRMGRYLGLLSDESFYQESPSWASIEMRNGTLFNEIDVARVAFPIVWSSSNSNLRKQQHGEEILSKL